MENRKMPIGIELVKRGIVKEQDVQAALDYQRNYPSMKIGDILHDLNLCDAQTLITNIGDILGEKGIVLNSETLKIRPTEYLSLEVCKKYKCLPFEVNGSKIKVCFPDKAQNAKVDPVRMLLLNKGLVMERYITFERDIEKAIQKMESEVATTNITEASSNSSATIIELIDSIIRGGMEKRASDIHIEPEADEVRVRYRIDGELFTEAKLPKEKQQQITLRLKAISNMHQEKQEAQDGRITMYEDYNIRVSSQPNINGEKFVLRLLKKNVDIMSIFDLGYPGTEEEFKANFNKKNSMTIIAAPTGAGKTTTLYSIVDYLNSPEVNITTIEDPVEIRIDGLNQIEIGNKSTFSGALRTVLRQDPDIILLGEIRDKETAEIAIQAGQTGHYVLSTIHTIDSIEVINRLRKMGVSDYDIASTLATTVSQRLIRRICPNCKKERDYTDEEKNIINKIAKKYGKEIDFTGKKTYDAIGCKKCNNIGYYGRIGIFETLEITDEIKELISKGASTMEIRSKALEQNYRPLVIDGINKVLKGTTTLDELNRQLVLY